jgi:hypothetical protein
MALPISYRIYVGLMGRAKNYPMELQTVAFFLGNDAEMS